MHPSSFYQQMKCIGFTLPTKQEWMLLIGDGEFWILMEFLKVRLRINLSGIFDVDKKYCHMS